MKPKLVFAHLCDSAFFSQEGKLNIIGIVKTLHLTKLPATYPKLTCVLHFTTETLCHQAKIQILKTASREVISKLESKLVPPSTNVQKEAPLEMGIIIDFALVQFEEAGKYYVEAWIDDEIVATLPFLVEAPTKKKA